MQLQNRSACMKVTKSLKSRGAGMYGCWCRGDSMSIPCKYYRLYNYRYVGAE